MTSFTTLPYDVVQAIIGFLDSHDALNLALTSRYCYDLAIKQASTFVYCTSFTKLLAAWESLVKRHPERARHVRIMTLAHDVESDEEVPWSEEDVEGWDLDCDLVRDLLIQARYTSHVFIRGWAFMDDARVSTTLQALKNLVHFDVYGDYDNKTFAAIGALRSPLRVLSVRGAASYPSTFVPVWEVLLYIAPHKSSLRALRLAGPSGSLRTARSPHNLNQLPCFPLCRRLVLSQTDLAYGFSDIFASFPNLEAVDLPTAWYSTVPEQIPPLRYLRLHRCNLGLNEAHAYSRWTVRYVHYTMNVLFSTIGTGDDGQSELAGVAEVSPVALHLHLDTYTVVEEMVTLWNILVIATPRLRYLDLKFELLSLYAHSGLGDVYEEIASWLRHLSFNGATIPLRCLRIGLDLCPGFRVSVHSRPWFNGEEPAEDHRSIADAILALPHRIAAEIPTLRFLAISAQTDYRRAAWDRWSTEDSYYDLHALDADVTWWRIEREEGDPVLHRMGTVSGARVWKSLIEKDEEDFRFEACS